MRTFAQTETVTELIDSRPLSAFQLRVLLLCGITVVLDGFDTQTIGFIAPAILAEFEAPPAAFGPVMSAALVGILIGAIVGGMLADRIGRRIIILSAAAGFGILSLLTARAASMDALILLRFLTGLGLGAALPNLVAMSNEYSPRRLKALTVVLVFAGFPLGAALGGLTSAHIVQEFGWRSIFVVGGVAPLILAILMWWLLPESLQVLLRRSDPRSLELANQHLTKIVGSDVPRPALASAETTAPKASVLELFGEGYRVRTLMLWTVHLATLLIYYFLVGWLPTILAAAGLQIRVAILVTVLLSLGAIVGGISLARFVDRHGSFRVLIIDYFAAGVICVLIGALHQNVAATAVLVFLAGFCVGGAQLTAYALAASLYPGRMRGTGVGWAIGSSRIGSILGPVIGGALIGSNLGMQMLFALLAIPAVLAACAVGVIVRLPRLPD